MLLSQPLFLILNSSSSVHFLVNPSTSTSASNFTSSISSTLTSTTSTSRMIVIIPIMMIVIVKDSNFIAFANHSYIITAVSIIVIIIITHKRILPSNIEANLTINIWKDDSFDWTNRLIKMNILLYKEVITHQKEAQNFFYWHVWIIIAGL